MGEGNFPARTAGGGEFPSQEGWGRGIPKPGGLGEGNFLARRVLGGEFPSQEVWGGEFPSQEGWGGELPSEEGAERIICIMYRGSGVKGVQNSNPEGMEAKSNQMAATETTGNQRKRSFFRGNWLPRGGLGGALDGVGLTA